MCLLIGSTDAQTTISQTPSTCQFNPMLSKLPKLTAGFTAKVWSVQTYEGKNVEDLAQCKGDKFLISCMPQTKWMMWNNMTGQITVNVPKDVAAGSTSCLLKKVSANGKITESKIVVTVMAASKCKITNKFADRQVMSVLPGDSPKLQLVTTIGAMPRDVFNLKQDCPGDEFDFMCDPKYDWIKFDKLTGGFIALIPKTQAPGKFSCAIIKRSEDAVSNERKTAMFEIKASASKLPTAGLTKPSRCTIGKNVRSGPIPAKVSMQVASDLNGMMIQDIATQCPGDKFNATCTPASTFLRFDAQANKAYVDMPANSKSAKYQCVFTKTSADGMNEKRVVDYTFTQVESQCSIDISKIPKQFKSGESSSVMTILMRSTQTATPTTVGGVMPTGPFNSQKMCPGDKFAMKCQNMDYTSFDAMTGQASLKSPKLINNKDISCTINKTDIHGKVESKSFVITLLGMPKSLCMLNPDLKSMTVKEGETASTHIANILSRSTTMKPMPANDLAKSCPGDKFFLNCQPQASIKLDITTGKMTGTAPRTTVKMDISCVLSKKSENGQTENKNFKITVLPLVVLPKCKIAELPKEVPMKAGQTSSNSVVTLLDGKTIVKDVATQCPGESFNMSCMPMFDFVKFDQKTGTGHGQAPILKETKSTMCTVSHKTTGGKSVTKDFKLTVLAAPKSVCSINADIKSITMKPGTKGSLKIATLGRVAAAGGRRLASCGCNGAGSKPCKHKAAPICYGLMNLHGSKTCPQGTNDCRPKKACPCATSHPCKHNGNHLCFRKIKLWGKWICNAGTTDQAKFAACKAFLQAAADKKTADAAAKKATDAAAAKAKATADAAKKLAASLVTDLAKQCPGDKWTLVCTPMSTYLKYDDVTGKASTTAPSGNKRIEHNCKIVKNAFNGEQERKEFKLTILPMPKSVCTINPDVKSSTVYPSGPTGQGSMNMASLLTATPATTTGPANSKVTDVAKQCPGDVFAMTCSDQRYLSFDPKTSAGKSAVPHLKADLKVTCNIIKTAKNGEIEKRDVTVVYKAAPKSECTINPDMKDGEFKFGYQGEANIAKRLFVQPAAGSTKPAGTDMSVKDIVAQCPGDKFNMVCTPMQKFTKFDVASGKASVNVPQLAADVKMSCLITKKALNGETEEKTVTFKYLLHIPPSVCKINPDAKSAEYPSGPAGQGSLNMASLLKATPATTTGKANDKVTDIAKQCPGDVFAMTCSDMKFFSFDAKTSTGKSVVPFLKTDLKVTCKIIKTAKNGEIEKKELTVVYKAAPKSECRISPDIKDGEYKFGFQGKVNVAERLFIKPAAGGVPAGKDMKVTNVGIDCEGDDFDMVCTPAQKWANFDQQSGMASVEVPLLKVDIKQSCVITKKAQNGDIETKTISFKYLAAPTPECMINPDFKAEQYKSEFVGELNVAKRMFPMPATAGKAASTDHKVTDVTAQCPHSKFSMVCTPAQGGFYKYDAATGRASVKVPILKDDVKVSCKVHKQAINGDHETRVVDITFLAAPKSVCSINADIKSNEMAAGTTKSVQIATLGRVAAAGGRRLATCGCNGAGAKPCKHKAAPICYGLMNLHGSKTCPQGTNDCRPKKACPCATSHPCKHNGNHLCFRKIKLWGKWICNAGTTDQAKKAACGAFLKKAKDDAAVKKAKDVADAAKKTADAAAKKATDAAAAVQKAKADAEAAAKKATDATAKAKAALAKKAADKKATEAGGTKKIADDAASKAKAAAAAAKKLVDDIKNANAVTDLAKQCPGDKWSMVCVPMPAYLQFDKITGKASATAPRGNKKIEHDCKIVKNAFNGEQERKEFKLTMLPIPPKSKCMINPEVKSSEQKSGFEGAMNMLVEVGFRMPGSTAGSTMPAAGAPKKVSDVAQQCPGDVITMKCSDMQYYKFDAKTSITSAKVPHMKQDVTIKCTVEKKASNGEVEKKEAVVKYLATPKSLCMINPDVKSQEQKSGFEGNMKMGVTVGGFRMPGANAGSTTKPKPDNSITDVAKQCPGDKFTFNCSDMQYYKWDPKTTNVAAKVPHLKQDVTLKCTVEKKALNGDVEKKEAVVKYLAAPKSVCAIDTSKIPQTMQAGIKGSLKVIRTIAGVLVQTPPTQCPNDTFEMKCSPAAASSFTNYNKATGEATITTPKSTTDQTIDCKITQTNPNEAVKSKSFQITIKATATVKSQCTIIDLKSVPKTMATGFKGELNLAWTISTSAKKGEQVVDIAKQCPGDRFYMECSPKLTYIGFNAVKAIASIVVPEIKNNQDVSCSIVKKSTDGTSELKKMSFTLVPKAVCPQVKCVAPAAGCKNVADKTVNNFGCPQFPCGKKVCEKKCKVVACTKEMPKPGCTKTKNDAKFDDGCPKFPCGETVCKKECPVVKCAAPKAGCKIVKDDSKNKDGCLITPCGKSSCCAQVKCVAPKAGCKYVTNASRNAEGCPVHPCGKLECKKECPKATCVTPKKGCKYVKDTTLNKDGCPVLPCGKLECKKECKAVVCTKEILKAGCTKTKNDAKFDDGCPKFPCGETVCKKECPVVKCAAPKAGCKIVKDESKDANGCLITPCGKSSCCAQVKCVAPKAGCKYVTNASRNAEGCPVHPCGKLECKKECPKATCGAPAAGCRFVKDESKNKDGCPMFPCGKKECKTTCKKVACTQEMPKLGCTKTKNDAKFDDGCPKFPCGEIKCKACPVAKCVAPKPKAGCRLVRDDSRNKEGCLVHLCPKMVCAGDKQSVCRINPELKSVELKGGSAGSVQVASLMAVAAGAPKNVVVTDIAAQCAGDEFKLACKPQPTWVKYDSKTGKASAIAPKLAAVAELACTVEKITAGKVVDKRVFKVIVHADKKPNCPVAKCVAHKPKAGCKLVRDETKKADGCYVHLCAKMVCATTDAKKSMCRINPTIGDVALKGGSVVSVKIANLIDFKAVAAKALLGPKPKGRRLASCGCNGAGSKPCKHKAAPICYGLMNLHGSKTCPQGTNDCRPKKACPCSTSHPCKHNGNHLCFRKIKLWGKWICNAGTTDQAKGAACGAFLKAAAEKKKTDAAAKKTADAAKKVTDAAKKVADAAKKVADAAAAKAKAAKAAADAAAKKTGDASKNGGTDAQKKAALAAKLAADAAAKKYTDALKNGTDAQKKAALAAKLAAEHAAKQIAEALKKLNLDVTDLARQCPGDKFTMVCKDQATWATFDAKTGVATARAPKQDKTIVMNCKISKHGVDGVNEFRDFKVTVLPFKYECPVAKCTTQQPKAGCKRVDSNEVDSRKCKMFPCGKIVCAGQKSMCKINPTIKDYQMKGGSEGNLKIAHLLKPKGRRLAACGCNGAGSKPCKHKAAPICYGLMNLHGSKTCPQGTNDCRPKKACPCATSHPCKHNGNHLCFRKIKLWGKWICNAGTTDQAKKAACGAFLKAAAEKKKTDAAAKKVTDAAKKVADAAAAAVKKAKATADAAAKKATDAAAAAAKAKKEKAADAAKKLAEAVIAKAKAAKAEAEVKAKKLAAELALKKVEVTDLAAQCPGDKFVLDCKNQPAWATFDKKTGIASAKAPKSKIAIDMKCKISKFGVDGKDEHKDFKVHVPVHVEPVVPAPKPKCSIMPVGFPLKVKAGTSATKTVLQIAAPDSTVFSFRKDKKTWTEAQTECKKWGGALASVNNKAQHEYFQAKSDKQSTYWMASVDASLTQVTLFKTGDATSTQKENFVCQKTIKAVATVVTGVQTECVGDKLYMTCDPKADYITLDDKTGKVTVKPAADAKSANIECSILKKDKDDKQQIVKVQVEIEGKEQPSTCSISDLGFPFVADPTAPTVRPIVMNKGVKVANFDSECMKDSIKMVITPEATFVNLDTKTGELTITPTATTKPGKYDIAVTRTSVDGKTETKKMHFTVAAPACPVVTSLFPMTVKVGETKSKSVLKADDSAQDMSHCAEKFEIASVGPKASFFSIDQTTGKLTANPPKTVASAGIYMVGIKSTVNGKETIEQIKVTADADCASKGYPAVAFPKAISTSQTLTYDVPTSLNKDSEGKSWSDICGKATVSIENAPKGITVNDSGVVTIDGTNPELFAGTYTFTVIQKLHSGEEKRTQVSFVVNCELISYDKTVLSEHIKDIDYDNLGQSVEVPFSFIAFPTRCGGNAVHTITVAGLPQPAWIMTAQCSDRFFTTKDDCENSGKQWIQTPNSLLIKIDTISEKNIGSFPVKITSHIGGIKTARDIDFKVNLFIDSCLMGGVLPTSILADYGYEILEKQTSYPNLKIGSQTMATQIMNIASCKSSILNTVQVQLPNTHAWVDFTEGNAPQITKYLKWDSDKTEFTARVKDGVEPSDIDDFKAPVRVFTTVTHDDTKRLIGEALSTSWVYKVEVKQRPEDVCKVEYLKMDWTTSSAYTTGKPPGRRLQDFAMDDPMMDFSSFGLPPAVVAAPSNNLSSWPDKCTACRLTMRQTLKDQTLDFYPGEDFTVPQFIQVQPCGWTQTIQTTYEPRSSEVSFVTNEGKLTIIANPAAKAKEYSFIIEVKAQSGVQIVRDTVNFKVRVLGKMDAVVRPVAPIVPVVAPIVVTAAETAGITPTVTEPVDFNVPTVELVDNAFPALVDPMAGVVDVAVDDFTASMEAIDNGSNVAVDFSNAVPVDQNPADMTLVAAVSSEDDTSFAQLSFDDFMAMPSVDVVAVADEEPAVPAGVAPVAAPEPEVILPAVVPDFSFDFGSMFSFDEPVFAWRRRLAAVGLTKEADVYYYTKVTGAKGASFKVDIVFSDPSAVKKAKVAFTLSGKNGFKAKIGVPLPAQFKDKASASTGQMFADIILALFVINMFMVALSSGWQLYNTLQLVAVLSVMDMPLTANVEVVLLSLWQGINFQALNNKVFGKVAATELGKYLTTYGSAFTLVLVPTVIAVCGITYLVCRSLAQSSNETVKKVVAYVQKLVVFNFVIRAVLATFLQLSIMAFTGFYKHKSAQEQFAGISGFLQVLSCLVAIICFGAYLFAMKADKEILEGKLMRTYFGTLIDGLKTNAGRSKVMYTFVFLARRALFVLALLQENFAMRFTAVVALSMMYTSYILICKPHTNKFTHYLEVINECIFLLAIYMLPLFSKGFIAAKGYDDKMGWVFNVMVLIPLFGLNFLHTFVFGIQKTVADLKKSCAKKEKALTFELAPIADDSQKFNDADKFDGKYDVEATEMKQQKKQQMDVIAELPFDEVDQDQEKEVFLQAMQKRGLEVKNIEKDGNCVFRGIGLLLFEDQAKHMQVRHDVANQLRDQREKYEKNISYQQGIQTFDAYVQNMRLEGIWGDHIELQAAADLYGVDINVYTIGTGVERPNMIVECSGEIEYLPISLWYEDDNHYHAFKDSHCEPAANAQVEPEQIVDNASAFSDMDVVGMYGDVEEIV